MCTISETAKVKVINRLLTLVEALEVELDAVGGNLSP